MDRFIKGGKKKAYSSPELVTYGTVQELTQKIVGRGKADGQVVNRRIRRTSL
jgi:hypothetical protein